jgi:hypothetical protein
MDVVRCARVKRRIDICNVIGGLKETIDCFVDHGLIPDDDIDHLILGEVSARAPKEWGGYRGPGTWFTLRRLR